MQRKYTPFVFLRLSKSVIMSFRLKEDHLIQLIELMERHTEFAIGRLSVVNVREKFRELWKELANKLNSLGFGIRPVEKWQKTWADYKTDLKKKASEIKGHREATLVGGEINKKLTELELSVLAILGKTFFEGCGVKEQGLPSSNIGEKNTSLQIEVCTNTNNSSSVHFEPLDESSFGAGALTELSTLPFCSRNEPLILKPEPKSISKRRYESDKSEYKSDHDYLYLTPNKTPKKRLKPDNVNVIYKETVSSLEKINETVGTRLQNLESTVVSKMDALCETVANGLHSTNQTLRDFVNQRD